MYRGMPERSPPPTAAKAARSGRKQRKPAKNGNGLEDLRGMSRSLAIIEHLAVRPGRVVDVTQEMGLPWATVHRIITQLTKADFLRRDPETKRYEIGPALWFAGATYMANHRVLRAAIPYLQKPEQIEGIAVQLAERVRDQAVAIYSAQPYATEIAKAQYGYHFPLHCGSKGRVLLAFETPDFIEQYLRRPLERLTELTITDPEVLRKDLEEIRQRGYSVTIADVQPFTGSMAAPIRDVQRPRDRLAVLHRHARRCCRTSASATSCSSISCTPRIWHRWISAGGRIRSTDGNRRPLNAAPDRSLAGS